MKSKDQIAQDNYGYDYSQLEAGEKASVTKKYNKQPRRATPSSRASTPTTTGSTVTATIGRVGVNGTKKCILNKDATVLDLVEQSGFILNKKKEGVLLESSGETVMFSHKIIDKETYAIAVGIDSNC